MNCNRKQPNKGSKNQLQTKVDSLSFRHFFSINAFDVHTARRLRDDFDLAVFENMYLLWNGTGQRDLTSMKLYAFLNF